MDQDPAQPWAKRIRDRGVLVEQHAVLLPDHAGNAKVIIKK